MLKSQGIYLSWIVVNDIEKALKFYTEVAGLELKEYHKEYRWAELQGASGAILGIGEMDAESPIKPGDNAVVTLAVEDLDQAKAHFLNKGASLVGDIIEVPGHVRMQTFKDADGNVMQLVQKLDHTM